MEAWYSHYNALTDPINNWCLLIVIAGTGLTGAQQLCSYCLEKVIPIIRSNCRRQPEVMYNTCLVTNLLALLLIKSRKYCVSLTVSVDNSLKKLFMVKVKIKQSRNRPGVAQSVPDVHDIRHMKVVRSSASRTGRLYPQEMVVIFSRG